MPTRHHAVTDTPVLTNLAGEPLRSLAGETEWRLEDREDSTNRLTLTVPLDDARDVVNDAEVIFRSRRFKIVDVDRGRVSGSAVIEADEAQVELATIVPARYALNGVSLSAALTRALQGTLWTSGGVHDDTGTYYADFQNESVTRLLRFLQSQSKQWLHFDSLNRVVSLREDTPPPLDRVFTYGAGVTDVQKRETPPLHTVIEPTGRGGMTIENVNGGSRVVEDFGWYTGLGMSLSQARARFTKKDFWHDERYVYAMNLLRDAQAKLAEEAYPQITYKVDADPGEIDGVRLGDRAWVVDEVLGVKLATRVARLVTSNVGTSAQMDLDYLPRSFGSIRTEGDGDSTAPTGTDMVQFQVKNEQPVTLGQSPVRVLESTVQVIADTAFQVGVTVRLETTHAGEIGGYFLLDGVRIDPEIRQTAVAGWHTFGLPFLVTQVTEGSKNFDLYMTVGNGSATVPIRHAEMFIVTRAALGGISNARPDRAVQEHIGRWLDEPGVTDAATADFPVHMGEDISDQIERWLEGVAGPADHAGAMLSPILSLVGTVLTLSGMLPEQIFTIAVESADARVGEDSFTADELGVYVLDLAEEFNLPAGDYDGMIVEFDQPFTFTVEDDLYAP